MAFSISEIEDKDRAAVVDFLKRSWGATILVSRGRTHYAESLPGFCAKENRQLVGLITYAIENEQCEIVTLDSKAENAGLGSKLINEVIEVAEAKNCQRVWLVTTNDNIRALRFYQKRGFEWIGFHRNSVKESRKIKPEIPEVGLHDIPIKHEIEFEIRLERK